MKIRKWLGEKGELGKKEEKGEKGKLGKKEEKKSCDMMSHQIDWNLKPMSNRLGKKGEKSKRLTLQIVEDWIKKTVKEFYPQ